MAAADTMVAARRALDELYRAHAAEVYRYAYATLGNHADAEDVTQTTFVNALRALERGERPRKPSNWLITIAHNIARQRFRQQQSRPTEVELVRDVPDEPADHDGPSMEELVRALQRIPQSQREALVLRELEGRSYAEISQILDLSNSALETLLFRARRSLADELENVATCERAELDISRRLDVRLSRKERKRLDDHIAECPSCARLQASQGRHRHAVKGLALLPLPLSLTFFKGAPSASAAAGLPTIGAAGTAAAVGGGAAAGGSGTALGGLALGGLAIKVAAAVAAVSVAGSVGYVGAKHVQHHHGPPTTPARAVSHTAFAPRAATTPAKPRPSNAGTAHKASATSGKHGRNLGAAVRAQAKGAAGRGASSPRRTKTVHSARTASHLTTTQVRHRSQTPRPQTPKPKDTTAPPKAAKTTTTPVPSVKKTPAAPSDASQPVRKPTSALSTPDATTSGQPAPAADQSHGKTAADETSGGVTKGNAKTP